MVLYTYKNCYSQVAIKGKVVDGRPTGAKEGCNLSVQFGWFSFINDVRTLHIVVIIL